MAQRNWNRDELLLAFNLYCKIPFGRMHWSTPEVIELSTLIGRTPSAVAMKLVNFASLDPAHQRRNVAGLKNAGRGDREIFDEFASNWEQLAFESEQARDRILLPTPDSAKPIEAITENEGPTDREQLVRVRTVQRCFRQSVLASYKNQCAVCGIGVVELLNASHIIPWNQNVKRRADPTNGLALCSLHDRAFDRGFIAVDSEFRVLVSDPLRIAAPPEVHRVALIAIEGKTLMLPHRFSPDAEALRFHRDNIFRSPK